MNRQKKQSVIEAMRADFSNSPAAFLVGVQGLTVGQMQKLRQGLRQKGGSLRVAKNTLASIAIGSLANDLRPYLKRQIAVAFASQDASTVAKVLCDYASENAKFTIVAGCLESRVINQDMVKFLGSLPPREVVIAQTCGMLKAPLVGHVSVLNQLVLRLLWVIKQASEK